MPSPLLAVDANSRHAGFKSISPSKIPPVPAVQRNRSAGRRSPFSVSSTGSPHYTAISPTVSSKIPRKSQTPTPTPAYVLVSKPGDRNGGVGLKLTSLPMPQRNSHPMTMPTHVGAKKFISASICDKPLPSPPIAQILNPNSPPKAQRTLVDAESGSPSEDEWPILHPENLSALNRQLFTAKGPLAPSQRAVSEGAAQPHAAHSFFTRGAQALAIVPAFDNQPRDRSSSVQDLSSSSQKFAQITEPRESITKDAPVNTFHAISTGTKVVLASPVANRTNTLGAIPIPPRISSKRSSLLLSTQTKSKAPMPLPLPQPPQVKPGSTKWPVLDEKDTEECIDDTSTLLLVENQNTKASMGLQSTEINRTAHFQHGSVQDNAFWSPAPRYSLSDGRQRDDKRSTRIKRLSWRASARGSSPILTIFGDAHTVLFGRDDSMSDPPVLSDIERDEKLYDRSLNARPTSPQTTPLSIVSRSVTPNSAETEHNVMAPVKINPIRSMQPLRTLSTECASPILSMPISLALTAPTDSRESTHIFPAPKRSISSSSQNVDAPEMKRSIANPPSSSESMNLSANTVKEVESTISQAFKPPKEEQILVENQQTPPVSSRNHRLTKWMLPSFTSTKPKHANHSHSKTSSSMNSIGRVSTHDLDSNISASSPTFPSVAHSHDKVRQSGASRLRTTESAPSIRVSTPSGCGKSFSRPNKHQRSTPVSSPSPLIHRSVERLDVNHGSPVKDPTAKVVKIKRSFRNIFQKRDVERAGTKPMMVDTKQAFMMGTRSSLAKCIRNSTALSKVHLSKMSESKTELELRSECQVETINANHRVVQSSPEAASFDTSQQPSYAPRYDPATVVNNILDHVTSMSTDASDRLSGLEIAEAVLHSVECYREAKVSTEKARKHARDAELHADRAGMALIQLQKLCEPILDGQTLLAIKELVQQAGLVDSKKALESGVHEQ